MIFDSLILAAVTEELQSAIAGGKLERISQPSPLEIVLNVYHAGAKHQILLSCETEMARAHLTLIRRENPSQAPPFCMLLRKYLTGAWIDSVTLPFGFGERILHITFRAYDGAPYTLIAEIMGRHSNLILINGSGVILGAAKSVTQAVNRHRQIVPGVAYVPPPQQRRRHNPFQAFVADSADAMTPDEVAVWLTATFAGVSPLLAQEAALRAQSPLTELSLWEALRDVLSVTQTHQYAPRVWSDALSVTQGAYPIPLRCVPAADQHPRDSISLALDNAAASVARRGEFETARDSLQAALHRARKSREREREEVASGLANAQRADDYQQSGDLLLAQQHQIARGQSSALVIDYYAPPTPDGQTSMRTVALDPTLSARENAERYFKKARKARDSQEILQARQDRLRDDLAALEQAARALPEAGTAEQVGAIREPVAPLLSRRPAGGEQGHREGPKQTPQFDGNKIKSFRSPEGWEILVGENATSNDYLTTKIAASSDIWLHVRAATSAHGVIRAQNRPTAVPPAALQMAAEMVAARSEVKHSALIPVDYTLKKHVRKPRKSAPGSVTYQNEKTLYVHGIHD